MSKMYECTTKSLSIVSFLYSHFIFPESAIEALNFFNNPWFVEHNISLPLYVLTLQEFLFLVADLINSTILSGLLVDIGKSLANNLI